MDRVGVNISGNVSAQAEPGETVAITITDPTGKQSTIMAITDSNGNFTTGLLSTSVAGTYNFTVAMPADQAYNAPSPYKGTFTI